MRLLELSRRWLDLAGDVLGPGGGDVPWAHVAQALVEDFRATVAVVEREPQDAALVPVHLMSTAAVDLAFYRTHARDVPLLRHLGEQFHPPLRICTHHLRQAVEPAAERVLRRVHEDGLAHGMGLPLLPSAASGQRWLILARREPFTSSERHAAEHLHRLLAGVEHRVAVAAVPAVPLPREPRPGLTAREHAVLALMAEGLVTDAIGHRLGVSGRTVAKHQEHIYRKFGTSDRLTAVLRAQSSGLLRGTAG